MNSPNTIEVAWAIRNLSKKRELPSEMVQQSLVLKPADIFENKMLFLLRAYLFSERNSRLPKEINEKLRELFKEYFFAALRKVYPNSDERTLTLEYIRFLEAEKKI